VQLIWSEGDVKVQRLLFLNESSGEWLIPFNHSRDEAIIAISAVAPTTTEIATYEYALEPAK
jgi:hypothetical protein